MKRIYTLLLVLLCGSQAFSNNFYFAWDGFGMATKNNFNLAHSYGAYYYHGISRGMGLGTLEFYQTMKTYYSRERTASTGTTMQTDVTYRFFSPMAVFQLDHPGNIQIYTTGGIGELQGGSTLTLNKWSNVGWATPQGDVYNNEIDATPLLNKYVFRLGFGFVQFMKLGGNFHFFVNEDFGFLTSPIADVEEPEFKGVKTNVSQYLKPSYISLRVGVCFIPKSKHRRYPYMIIAGKNED